ncbi:multiple inositol polyphosphate phosphatase 1-like isoform X2 [Phymastichus coffea]|uniref:multiple inositol polyphosphate phosphatase 1-like isoform X2 n=1 Tax=Phymastichus coffea TaxID=108790 RepID=UPI00273CA02F|nr:multiple inositol polyphosphate phosphatase 1-like isoform X2 [Phymastichus coffea]
MLATFVIIADLLQVIAAAGATITTNASVECYERARDYYPYLGTKTAYENVHGDVTRLGNSCTPAQLWMLSRHGARYPSGKLTSLMLNMTTLRDRILENHRRGAGHLCARDLDELRDWQLDPGLATENADALAMQGESQMRELAGRLKRAFGDLLDARSAKPEDFVFRATDTQRTQASMRAFRRSFLDAGESLVRTEIPPVNDTLLLAQKFCPAWETGYATEHVSAERDRFTAGPEVRAVLRTIGRRLGFPEDVDFPTVESMYDACRYETAWHPGRASAWCLVFRGDELKVLEYRGDLDYYYFCGPGRAMSAKLGCRPLSDMLGRFRALAGGNSTNQPRGVFYFAHTVTLQTFMAALQMTEDSRSLLASNYADVQDRRYRTSLLGPFATNVLAVFYRCSESEKPYKVTIHTAEKLVQMAGCRNGLCDWDFLERKYTSPVEKCSMDFCYEEINAASSETPIHSELSALMILAFSARLVL